MEVEFEYDMFSEIAIGRGYDWIASNVDLLGNTRSHAPILTVLDRIQVSKITPGMIIPILSFTQDPPTYDNLRSYIPPAVYASIPDARLGVTNMVLIHANQLFTDWGSYPKCLTFEYAEDAKYTLLVFSELAISAQLYGPVIARKLQMAAAMPVASSTNINSRAAGTHMAMNGALIEKSSNKYAEEWLPVRRALHGDKTKIAAYMAGEVDPRRITSPKLMTKIRNSSLMPARLANLPIMQAGLLVKILTMNFCMVIDLIGTRSKTPDAAHLCMFYPAQTSSNAAAVAYHEFKTYLKIKDAVENFRLIVPGKSRMQRALLRRDL